MMSTGFAHSHIHPINSKSHGNSQEHEEGRQDARPLRPADMRPVGSDCTGKCGLGVPTVRAQGTHGSCDELPHVRGAHWAEDVLRGWKRYLYVGEAEFLAAAAASWTCKLAEFTGRADHRLRYRVHECSESWRKRAERLFRGAGDRWASCWFLAV